MGSAEDRGLKAKATDETTPEGNQQSALPSSAPKPAGANAPALKTANFVEPAWRGIKYITPELFRRRAYAYFGYHPSKSTMHRWLHQGRIYAVRVGCRWLIPESAWKEFLERCQQGERV